MVELIVIGFVAGIVAGISPCILPVLPVVLVAGATSPRSPDDSPVSWWSRRARPVAVVAGLVLSFSLIILVGSEVLSALGLPQDFLHDAGIVLLVVVGLGFLIPALSTLLERPFARIGNRQPDGKASGFVVGLALGILFVPCAGPILAAITVVGATHRVGWTAVFLTFAFGLGAAVPLLIVALAGNELVKRVKTLRRRAPWLRRVSGAVLIAMALGISFNLFAGLQTAVPGYTSALQNRLEGSNKIRRQLSALTESGHVSVALAKCNPNATGLVNCGTAPDFKGITTWLNTPASRPLTMAGLRGKVVLVDFWTYSCINCQRTLPHVEAWYAKYAKYGFVVVGVHTPEFSFEHVVSNVRAQAAALGVRYPVAIDDNYDTWNAYDNEYWPADYLVDANGDIRHIHFGEGDYPGTEGFIRNLIEQAHPGTELPPPTDVADETPTTQLSPETYIGYENLQYKVPTNAVKENAPAAYHFPKSLPLGGLGFSGTWTERSQEATAGTDAKLELGFLAHDVYLVLGGMGTLMVSINGQPTQTLHVAGVPKLYTLYHARSLEAAKMLLHASPGVQAYDFTFG
jgi:cytochrome c biogenesis protein CcdA/thiol-disulfide isomerase/thioredoxin